MAKKSKTGVLKRLREVKKAERAQQKQSIKAERRASAREKPKVATKEDLEGYGFPSDGGDEGEDADSSR